MTESVDFSVEFWGVRGSFPRPDAAFLKYGGNTSCIEMRCGGRRLIFDAGTGVFPLGQSLQGQEALHADVFFTHTHFDHICGMPFFLPAFKDGNAFDLWAGHLLPENTLREAVADMMKAPLFPVPLDIFHAEVNFHDFKAGETLEPGHGIRLRTAPLNHPNGATGYRVEYGGRSACYITDTEHKPGAPDETILALIEGADFFIYDSTYTDEQFADFAGWGHSTWQEGVRLAEAAGVGTLAIFHHAPEHDDQFMDGIAEAAEAARPGTLVAREGMVLKP